MLAGGAAKPDGSGLIVSARRGDTEYGIVSTAFLEYAFRTDSYTLDVTFNADGSWSYISDTMLTVRGQAEPSATATATRWSRSASPSRTRWP